MFPTVEASKTAAPTSVPQLAGVGVGNGIDTLLLVSPPVPEDTAVVPEPWVPAQLIRELDTLARA